MPGNFSTLETGPESTSKLKDTKRQRSKIKDQRHKKTTATNNDKCRKMRDKKVQKFQNFSLSCLYLSKFVTVVSHCLSNFLLSFIFDCSFFPRHFGFFSFGLNFLILQMNFFVRRYSDEKPSSFYKFEQFRFEFENRVT